MYGRVRLSHCVFENLMNLGERASDLRETTVMRFLLQEGNMHGWEAVVFGAVEGADTQDVYEWLMDVWPELPWADVITFLLSISFYHLVETRWLHHLVTVVPSEQVFCASSHLPIIIEDMDGWGPHGYVWIYLWCFMDVVGGSGLKEALEYAAVYPPLKRALARYIKKRRQVDLEKRDILRLLIPADDVVDIIMKHADLVV